MAKGLEVPSLTPVLSVKNLTTSFRVDGVWTPVVKGISFDVGQGETVAIVGESGSGKSVTALSIMGLLPPANSRTSGEILLDGRDLLKMPETEMRKVRGNLVSMIFQEPMTSLNPVLTIGFQIAEALIYHRVSTAPGPRQRPCAFSSAYAFPPPPRACTITRIAFPAACASA